MGRAIKPSGKKQSQPSMSVQMAKAKQDQLRGGQLPADVGLLPDTFIMPRGRNLPSWFGNFTGRMVMERKRLRIRATEFYGMLLYRYFMVRPRPRLRLRTLPGIAKSLHHDMYTQFANGNLAPIESKILDGMLSSLRRRISQRTPGMSLRWTLHKYLSRPKIVSYKPGILPGQKGQTSFERNGIVQAVVRIHSLQSLQHVRKVSRRGEGQKLYTTEVLVDAQGQQLPESEQEEGAVPRDAKEQVEYFVIQKNLRAGKESDWMVWGTAEEMTLEKVRKEQNVKKPGRQLSPKTA